MKLFRDGCDGCHGDGSKPSVWGTTSFLPRVPQFATEPPHRPDWQIHWIVKNGIRNTGMGGWEQLLSDDKIWTVSTIAAPLACSFAETCGNYPSECDGEYAC
jgi:mono/diheme cytochrome c family protein